MAVAHVRTHVAMLAAGMRRHDRAEVLGQLLRIARRRTGLVDRPLPDRQHRRRGRQRPSPDAHPRRPPRSSPAREGRPRHRNDRTGDLLHRHHRPRDCLAGGRRRLGHGDTYDLRIAPVVKQLGDDRVRMLAYNGSIPGPTLRSPRVRDQRPCPQRRRHRGHRPLARAPPRQQVRRRAPRDPGADPDRRRVHLPPPLPGPRRSTGTTRTSARTTASTWASTATSSSSPPDADYWAPVNREIVVTLDDVLVEDGQHRAVPRRGPTHVAMGRFGNVMLTGGETNLDLDARAGEVVRFYFTNTANTRLFNVALPGGRMKLVGGDSGRYEHETVRRRGAARPLRARHRRRPVRRRRDLPARAPHPRPHLRARHRRRRRPTTSTSPTSPSSSAPDRTRADRRTGAARSRPRTTARQDARVRVADAAPLRRPDDVGIAWTCPMHPEIVRQRARDVSDLRDEARVRHERRRRTASRHACGDRPHDIHAPRRPATVSSGKT